MKKVAYGELKQDIANILSTLCKRKGVEIVEAEKCPDHVHMLVRIPPSMSVSSFVGYLNGKSTLMIFERHANLKYKYGNQHFWCRGYYVDTVGKNANSRLIVQSEFYDNQRQEVVEDTFHKAILKYGKCDTCYLDYAELLTMPKFYAKPSLAINTIEEFGIVC